MNYLVFARKFRPQSFEEVVGQEPIVTTLKNAIRQERVPQNFLFAGPRGVGKTSTARILAKALNCAEGPAEKFCNRCPACTEITQGNSLDVLEIDGASNRGIDEIRSLRETVKFKPVTGRHKIFIIDEVHMLTQEAFNALLKTLEEPPPHVKFIFATTEIHKVPLTILSRCQRFNFRRIRTALIQAKLEEIAHQEKLKWEKGVPFLLAKAGEGSLRDAEGLLDQMASFSKDQITEEDVLLALGLAPEELYLEVLDALKAKDGSRVFSIVGDLYESGRDLAQFARGLLEFFRHLLLVQCTDKAKDFIEMSGETIGEIEKRKALFSRGELLMALSLLGNLQSQLRRNLAGPRLLVETTLLKLLHLDGLATLESVVETSEPRWVPPNPSPVPARAREARPESGPGAAHATSRKAPAPAGEGGAQKPPSEEAPAEPVIPWTLNEIGTIWPRVVDYVKTKRMSVGIFLSESSPVEAADRVVTLGFPPEFQFHKEMLEKDTNRRVVEEAFQAVGGRKARVEFVITQPEKEDQKAQAQEKDSSDLPNIITQALNIFEGAKIIKKE